jgi:hypothetical protein
MSSQESGTPPSREGFLAILLCVLVGIPLFVFLNVLTSGLFILLLLAAGGIAVFGAFHYFLWGRAFNREVAGEREEEELREHSEEIAWTRNGVRRPGT